MSYRDEELAAAARIERLESELAEVRALAGDPAPIAALHREAHALDARRNELEEQERTSAQSGARRTPKSVWLGLFLSIVPPSVALCIPLQAAWVFLLPLPFSALGVGLVLRDLILKWRAGREPPEAVRSM